MKKKIVLITQAKGGSGKSVLAFMLAEKYQQAAILGLDDATTTSMKQLAYRKPVKVSFLDAATKRIDRGAFNSLFESVAASSKELFIADLGASVAEQLPKYLSLNGIEKVAGILQKNEIDLQLICVVGGGNIFRATMEYLMELTESVNSKIEIVAATNGFFPFSPDQARNLDEYAKASGLTVKRFDLIHDKGEMAMQTVENVMNGGNGLTGLNPFKLIYFTKGMEELDF
ncbi:MAG TPA: hypothetical protein VK508_12690 [Cyclobacteriaceae bacterium]|nr:hypothetical protein [Cyclobacteriaceae bacterium]